MKTFWFDKEESRTLQLFGRTEYSRRQGIVESIWWPGNDSPVPDIEIEYYEDTHKPQFSHLFDLIQENGVE